MAAEQRGWVVYNTKTPFQPKPEEVLITTAPRDVYENDPVRERLPVFTANGFQNGFSEYTTHLPEAYHISTNQPCYGLQFLKANVPGPTFLQYPTTSMLHEHLSRGHYKVLGISSFTWTLPWAIEFARLAKTIYGIREVWLGSYGVMTEDPEMKNCFDRLFWGYSESTLRQALQLGPIGVKQLRHPDLTTRSNWLNTRRLVGHTIFQRGCYRKCIYCADTVFYPGGEPALDQQAIEDILDFYQSKGIRSVYFSNHLTRPFTPTGKRTIDSVARRGMRFGMMTSFLAITEKGDDGLKELVDNGLTFLLVALETLNDATLDRVNRAMSRKLMVDTLKTLNKLRVTVTSTYIICFEEDTPKSIREAKREVIDLGVTFCLFNIYTPLPSTPLYQMFKRRQLINDWDWTHWTGEHLLWKHPCISPEEARELLTECRAEVNHPEFNRFNREEWKMREGRPPIIEYDDVEAPISVQGRAL